MRHGILFALALLLSASPAFSLQADLNKDGVVDFDDFFLFTDQFGQMGEPESSDTVVVLRIDTLYVDPADTVTRSGMPITFADPARNLPCAPWSVSLTDNLVVDLDPLQGLANLRTLTLASNAVRDIKPLAGNPLSVLSSTTYVRAMQDRGATVTADAFVVTFADSLLEVGIRAALMQPEGDLLHLDLGTLTVLDVATDFTSLSGLEFVRDLVHLSDCSE